MDKKVIFMVSGVALLLLFFIGSLSFKGQEAKKIESAASSNASVFDRAYSQSLGDANAKVVITEFFDPGCETCRSFHPFVKSAIDAFPGKVRLVLKYNPLHDGADYMVKVLEAARKQGKYWETLQIMYDTQPEWASHSHPQPQLIWQYLPQVGLDVDKLKADMDAPDIAKLLQQDIADAASLNVRKTPGFFVNGKPLEPFGAENLKTLILSELARNYPSEFGSK